MQTLGRPTSYSEEMLQKAEEYIWNTKPENQDLVTIEGLALYLGVSRDTLYEWAKVHKDFSDTLDKLMLNQKVDLIKIGIYGGKEINAVIVKLLLMSNHGLRERTDVTTDEKKMENLVIVKDSNPNGNTVE